MSGRPAILTGPEFIDANGVRLAVWERPGADPPVFFAHATGLHARTWNQIIARIANRHAIAFDMRGHGLSAKPASHYEWHIFGEDTAALARALGLRGATGVGHSMGGHSLAYAAAVAPDAFAELLLIDPVIMPLALYTGEPREPHFTRRRRNQWASPDEMFEAFKDRVPFSTWDPEVLRDYCDYGLVPAADGNGYMLACPPEIEGSIYENSTLHDANIHDRLERIEAPVTVIRAPRFMRLEGTMDMTASLTAPDLATRFRHGRDVVVPHSHFIPMEAPALIAEYVNGLSAGQRSRGRSPYGHDHRISR
ncbi:MAG TPA: alpha/beta hydrolase [Bryobacteraceae bacterium]|nr:alpha/beta hydrolase [Bryobacteraceae bacterium]